MEGVFKESMDDLKWFLFSSWIQKLSTVFNQFYFAREREREREREEREIIWIALLSFTAEGKSDRPPIRAFSRRFVTVPHGAGYVHQLS